MIASKHFIKRTSKTDTKSPVDLGQYLEKDTKILPPQTTINLSNPVAGEMEKLPAQFANESSDILYTIRDADTGEILKIGKTKGGDALTGRLSKYRTSQNWTGRNITMDAAVVEREGAATLGQAENAARENLLNDARQEVGLGENGVKESDVLPWDNTRVPGGPRGEGRLGRSGPGIPGVEGYRLSKPTPEFPNGRMWDGEKVVPIPDNMMWDGALGKVVPKPGP